MGFGTAQKRYGLSLSSRPLCAGTSRNGARRSSRSDATGGRGQAPAARSPADLLRFNAPLPSLATALAARKPVHIVALGSSSTQGIGASSPKASYPVMLQSELRRRFPDSKITVDNLGIGGQLATDMLRRMKKDVLARQADGGHLADRRQ